MRAAVVVTLALPLLITTGCASYPDDDDFTADASALARPAGYVSYTPYTTPYSGGYRPYYTYGFRTPLYGNPYYYRDRYPSRRLYRAPGYETFGEHPDPLYDRYPFDDGRYDRRFSERRRHFDYDHDYDRRFSERHHRGSYDRARHNARRSTYEPPGDRFRFRGDHFRGTTPGRSTSSGRR